MKPSTNGDKWSIPRGPLLRGSKKGAGDPHPALQNREWHVTCEGVVAGSLRRIGMRIIEDMTTGYVQEKVPRKHAVVRIVNVSTMYLGMYVKYCMPYQYTQV